MYSDISPTKPQSIFLLQTIDRQAVPSQHRAKVAAMGLGMGIAKSLPHFAATTADDAGKNYAEAHEYEVRSLTGALNELTPIDARMTQMYAFKFYQLVQGVSFQNVGHTEAALACSVAHALLGTSMYFSVEDIMFMEQHREAILKIAAATAPAIATTV